MHPSLLESIDGNQDLASTVMHWHLPASILQGCRYLKRPEAVSPPSKRRIRDAYDSIERHPRATWARMQGALPSEWNPACAGWGRSGLTRKVLRGANDRPLLAGASANT